MRFLKKASYRDIIGEREEKHFHYYDDISSKYKEFELFLTNEDLYELLNDNNNEKSKFFKLIDRLKKNDAVISAIHCPESIIKTCNEKDEELSENYLSLCEILHYDECKKIFKDLLILANKICMKQYENIKQFGDNVDEYYKNIIVVIHEGCEKGCINKDTENKFCRTWNENELINLGIELLKDLKLESTIKIALENITPFYSLNDNRIVKGQNCGWKPENQKSKKEFFEIINKNLKDNKKYNNLQFGACIDFCHIMVTDKIMGNGENKSKAIEDYFENIDYKDYIFLFHVSNYDGNLSHGQLFSFESSEDKKSVETIRRLCNNYAKDAPITFEMADGIDIEKASLNYEHIMFYFSNKHLFGRFSELLEYEKNKDLKKFFDDLFLVYSYDKKYVFEITNSLWNLKKIILKNTFIEDKKEWLFGMDFDKTEMNLSLVRLKAYVYYTRFCNLGNYLAENHYSSDNYIWDNDNVAAEDFGLAMKYFIFNDKIHQCVYTGIMFRFLIDMLPKNENFFRFNDGIELVNEMKLNTNNNVFEYVIGKIPRHISGDSINRNFEDGKCHADFYSVGKNFGKCLFKYFNSNSNNWTLQMYENKPINYVEYYGKRYSIQAFIQLVESNKDFIKFGSKIDISLDISRFASGRDEENTDGLQGFLNVFIGKNTNFTKENAASISDEEMLFTKLPVADYSYKLSKYEGVILKKAFLIMMHKEFKIPYEIIFYSNLDLEKEDLKNLKENIEEINKNKEHQIWQILKKVSEIFSESKIYKDKDYEDLKPYGDNNDKEFFDKYKNNIDFIFEEG